MQDILLSAALAILIPNLGGWIGAFIMDNTDDWYESLKKPSWTPPDFVFGPVWTTLYCCMGFASYLIWKETSNLRDRALPLGIYGINLALNWAWTPIFFGAHNIKLAFYEITAIWVTTLLLGIIFFKVDRAAGLLILPYFAWMNLATAINYAIYRDNK